MVNGQPATVDEAARFAAEAAKRGVKVEVVVSKCKRCGSTEPYRHTGTPSWQNRWTCPNCRRHESR